MSGAAARKITLRDAMEQLTSMFPDLPPDMIKQTLYSTKGYMERTIEILLTLQQQQHQYQHGEEREAVFPEERGVRHTLPADFLRPPSYNRHQHHHRRHVHHSAAGRRTGSAARTAMTEDERIARDLQRHMDLEENLVRAGLIPESSIDRHRRYAAANQRGNTHTTSRIGRIGSYPSGQTQTQTSQQQGGGSLSRFSELAKKKLSEFRSRFRRNTDGSSGSASGSGSGSASYSILSQRDDLDDYSDDDEEWNNRL